MLTKKQRDLLLFIDGYNRQTGLSPSFEEMKIGLDLRSKSGIHRLINALVERGFLERLPNKARALEVKKLPEGGTGYPISVVSPQKVELKAIQRGHTNETTALPLYGKIAAGTPFLALRQEHEIVSVPAHFLGKRACYALTIEGDSMIKAGIMDGDIVIIEECARAEDGDIVVALVDGEEVTLKRFRREVGMIVLMPENDAYQPLRLEPHRVHIQGKLRSLFRYY